MKVTQGTGLIMVLLGLTAIGVGARMAGPEQARLEEAKADAKDSASANEAVPYLPARVIQARVDQAMSEPMPIVYKLDQRSRNDDTEWLHGARSPGNELFLERGCSDWGVHGCRFNGDYTITYDTAVNNRRYFMRTVVNVDSSDKVDELSPCYKSPLVAVYKVRDPDAKGGYLPDMRNERDAPDQLCFARPLETPFQGAPERR